MKQKTWALEDHLCRHCGGRILRCVSGQGPTGGGNPVFKCADCGVATAALGPACLCWCGFHYRQNADSNPYICIPFSEIENRSWLRELFLSCGCNPDRGEVGIVLVERFRELCREHEG